MTKIKRSLAVEQAQVRVKILDEGWRFRDIRPEGSSPDTALPWLPAQVPGHVHVDLMNAGVIADPFYRMGERAAQWIDDIDWVYETSFYLTDPPAPYTQLVFEGLDTVAEIELNGSHVGTVDNMYVAHEIPVGALLRHGEGEAGVNSLQVTFRAARKIGRQRLDAWNVETSPQPSPWKGEGDDVASPQPSPSKGEGVACAENWYRWSPRSFVRKSQYMYGWDWGPELVSCGIWRPVKLVQVPVARLIDWAYRVEFSACDTASVEFEIYVDRAPHAATEPLDLTISFLRAGNESQALDVVLPYKVTVAVPDGVGRVCVSAVVAVEDAQRWWPNRHNPAGEGIHPTLYTVEFTLARQSHELRAGDKTPPGPSPQAEDKTPPQPSPQAEREEEIERRIAKIGLRTIELVREQTPLPQPLSPPGKGEPDGDDIASLPLMDGQVSQSFKFRVNGHDMFARGANWIPADSFPSRLENDAGKLDGDDFADDRVHELLWAACDAGYNMLRVWGGGLYESEHFYELCDEHGILVWQDFGYACAYYPDTGSYTSPQPAPWKGEGAGEDYLSPPTPLPSRERGVRYYEEAAREEAVAAVRRIRTHPSLALWCGNNENDWMYEQKWGGDVPVRFLGEAIYHEIQQAVVAAEDPLTPYWPSSPFGGDHANSPDAGDRHNWDVWHGVGDWTHYAEDNARFVSEFGFASSCSLAAWDTCLDDEDRSADSSVVRWHDKTRKGYETYLGLVRLHYPAMDTLEDLVYYTQLNQADALKFAVEHYRRLKGHCWGTLFWQFNDCWPTQSWAVVDSALQPKAAYYASRLFYAPILLSLRRIKSRTSPQPSPWKGEGEGTYPLPLPKGKGVLTGSEVAVFVTNDTLGSVSGKAVVRMKTFAGAILREAEFAVDIEPNGNAQVGVFDFGGDFDDSCVYISAQLVDAGGVELGRNLLLLAEPKDLVLPEPNLDITIDDVDDDTLAVSVSTDTFAGSVWFFTDGAALGAPEFSDNFFHLEAGEMRTVTSEKIEGIETVDELLSVLRVRTLWGEWTSVV